MSTIAEANRLYIAGRYFEALQVYEQVSNTYPQLAAVLEFSLLRCKRKLMLDSSVSVANHSVADKIHETVEKLDGPSANQREQITVTMTTIRSRLCLVRKVVESLHAQTLQPISIELNISSQPYLLDKGISAADNDLKLLSEYPLVRINWVNNIGPYRKIWNFLDKHFKQSYAHDKIFVTVDDDTIYPDYFLETLYQKYQELDCIVAFRGRHIELDDAAIAGYDKWSWGKSQVEMQNLPTGKDGILYSTKFFTRDFLELDDALSLAPTADDLWIKWHCALNGVPSVILNPEACTSDYKSFPVVDFSKEYRSNSLFSAHNSNTSQGGNDLTVKRLETYYLEKYGYNLVALIRGIDGVKV